MSLSKQHIVNRPNLEPIKVATRFVSRFLAVYAIFQIVLLVLLWINHIGFPLNLEAMELTVLQHLKRVMAGLPLYPEPTADFVALAYNPLYYFLAVPFAWILGANLFTLRFVAVLGTIGTGVVIFLAVRKATNSHWWGLVALGLFAAAYRVMDTYLDTAHHDSWLIFMILLGCYLIDAKQTQLTTVFGILSLVLAFWFKQQGALFVIGAVLYLIWRDGWQKALPFGLLAAAMGAGLYAAIPDWLLGARFHYFTWQVPRQWTEPTREELLHLMRLVLKTYGGLFAIGGVVSTMAFLQSRRNISLWYFMFPVALLSGVAAALLPGSNNNVYIPMGVWFIIVGVIGLKQLIDRYATLQRWGLHLVVLGVSFTCFLYNPMSVMVSPQAASANQDLVNYLNSLHGTVYAPWVGQLQDGYKFYPAAHWVPLEDIIRGPGVNEQNHPTITALLEPVLHPQSDAYILHNRPLETDKMLGFLTDRYVLDSDLGDRFKALETLPRRFILNHPRYLYRYVVKNHPNQF